MSAGIGYDTTTFEALRNELKALNARALADGLVAPRDGRIVVPRRPATEARPMAAGAPAKPRKGRDLGKVAVARLLALLDHGAEDTSPAVPGTHFTEAGVARLMAHLRRSRSRRIGPWLRFLQRAERYLSRPVPFGVRTVEDVGIERLQVFSRQLDEIAAGGWAQFQAARRTRLGRTDAASPEDEAVPAAARRKGPSR